MKILFTRSRVPGQRRGFDSVGVTTADLVGVGGFLLLAVGVGVGVPVPVGDGDAPMESVGVLDCVLSGEA